MKFMTLIFTYTLLSTSALATELKDYSPYKYEVLFTNPICKTYSYNEVVLNLHGEDLYSKTKNAYCKSSDSSKSRARKNSPHKRLKDWIKSKETKEIFMAYLSFSNRDIQKELCNAIRYRNIKVTLVIDSKNENNPARMATVRALGKCRPKNVDADQANIPVIHTSGHTGGAKYAHNKLFFVNPYDKDSVRIGFSSGNMSSGTTTHHENWHFITTSPKSYFSQAHLCLMNGVLYHDSSKKEFTKFISKCRAEITAEEEVDIKTFFVPGEGKAAFSAIETAIKKSKMIEIAAHRFSHTALVNTLKKQLASKKTKLRLVVDDDIYWTGVYKKGMGRNTLFELGKVRTLERSGMETKYIETYMNRILEPTSMQLQHNKFLIFTFKNNTGAVFTGAGNLTGTAFSTNYENFYYITIPEVFAAYKKQYRHFWNKLARSASTMPTELVLP